MRGANVHVTDKEMSRLGIERYTSRYKSRQCMCPMHRPGPLDYNSNVQRLPIKLSGYLYSWLALSRRPRTLCNTSKYPYLDILDLLNRGKKIYKKNNHISQTNI